MRVRVGGLALVLAIVAAPASANASSSVVVPDGCGDISQNVVNVNGTGVPFATDRAQRHDIDTLTMTAVPGGGVDIELRMCGAIPDASDTLGGSWQAGASIANGCSFNVSMNDDPTASPVRRAGVFVICPSVLETPFHNVDGASETYSGRFRDSEWSVTGNTVTWHVRPELLQLVHAGPTLTDPGANSRDGARVTEAGNDNTGAHGPGVNDSASGTGTLDRQ